MKRSRKLMNCQFLPYFQARTATPPVGTLWIDVSRSAESPLDQLSPFYPHGGIPIPGMPALKSDSVEGIWQGLKVIRGKIAPRFFTGTGQKRVGKPAGHQWGDSTRLLGLADARRKIYVPAYEWVLEYCVDVAIVEEIIARAFRGVPQFFYDREDNGSIEKDRPLAHAKLLVNFLNRKIEKHLRSDGIADSDDPEYPRSDAL